MGQMGREMKPALHTVFRMPEEHEFIRKDDGTYHLIFCSFLYSSSVAWSTGEHLSTEQSLPERHLLLSKDYNFILRL